MNHSELILRIVAIIFPIFAITATGYLYARIRRDSDLSTGNRNGMEIFAPAVPHFAVTERFGQQPSRVASIVLIGSLSSIVVIPVALGFVL